MDYTFHWRPVLRKWPDLLEAGLLTLEVAVLALLFGIVIGLLLALIRMSERRSITWFAVTWIEIARNTPALLQLFFFGFGLGAFGLHLSPYLIVLCGLSFNNAGYLAENFRGGFKAIPDTQIKAARSLGMTAVQTYTRIVIPQVFRIVYHPLTNQMVWSVLMSSLGMLVGFPRADRRDPVPRLQDLPHLRVLPDDRRRLLRDRQDHPGRLALVELEALQVLGACLSNGYGLHRLFKALG